MALRSEIKEGEETVRAERLEQAEHLSAETLDELRQYWEVDDLSSIQPSDSGLWQDLLHLSNCKACHSRFQKLIGETARVVELARLSERQEFGDPLE